MISVTVRWLLGNGAEKSTHNAVSVLSVLHYVANRNKVPRCIVDHARKKRPEFTAHVASLRCLRQRRVLSTRQTQMSIKRTQNNVSFHSLLPHRLLTFNNCLNTLDWTYLNESIGKFHVLLDVRSQGVRTVDGGSTFVPLYLCNEWSVRRTHLQLPRWHKALSWATSEYCISYLAVWFPSSTACISKHNIICQSKGILSQRRMKHYDLFRVYILPTR